MEQRFSGGGIVDFVDFDLEKQTVRELNQFLHKEFDGAAEVRIHNPDGAHHIACGMNVPAKIDIMGNAGYFVAGMNKHAEVTVHGSVGWSVAENIMSGTVRVNGYASECAGASGHGGLLVVEKDASSRCGISMKGNDIVVGGSVGHFSAFMAQAGRLVVCGDAGDGLGDSLYEAVIYVRGEIKGLGADAREEAMGEGDLTSLSELLGRAGFEYRPEEFKRIASARTLYHWNAEDGGSHEHGRGGTRRKQFVRP
ncbi:MAG: protein glxC [Actinomycetota bacterium]|jgi:glutamate synthase domain-containing protein 3|nr:protein glxC [Actinomycetota bacterium]